ncbi:MAG TPA: inositol monophosphatase family protein [Fibrobacteria bacterium]|nr:inositol monophosphatase family protein [Fibrobacteria bacterium]HOX52990.1 inositol monophosphatase family protein [Fibrobacteria bacterium]
MERFEHAHSLLPLARRASEILTGFCQGDDERMGLQWKGANDPVTEADRAVHRLCVGELPFVLPGVPLISEEGEGVTDAERFWSLDPVDGTSEFVEHLGEWAFQLALVDRNRPVAAVLALPAVDRIYYAEAGRGAVWGHLSSRDMHPLAAFQPLRRERLVVTRSLPRRASLRKLVDLHPGGDAILLGGVGYKVHAILSGEGDTYFAVPGTLHPWDLAAPMLVAMEAGLACRTFNGEIPTVPGGRDGLPDGHVFTRPRFLDRNMGFFARAEVRELAASRDPR